MSNVGPRIRELRKARGLTQEQVAELAHVNAQHFANIERSGGNCTIRFLERIAQVLQIPVAELLVERESSPAADRKAILDAVRKMDDDNVRKLRTFIEQVLLG